MTALFWFCVLGLFGVRNCLEDLVWLERFWQDVFSNPGFLFNIKQLENFHLQTHFSDKRNSSRLCSGLLDFFGSSVSLTGLFCVSKLYPICTSPSHLHTLPGDMPSFVCTKVTFSLKQCAISFPRWGSSLYLK